MKKRSYDKIEKKCLTCDESFCVPKHRELTAKYCSKECHNNRSQFFINCKKCGSIFRRTAWQRQSYVGEYCSKNCYNNREDDIFVKCDGCKKEIKIYPSQQKYYDRHYCSNKCRIKFGPIGKLTEDTVIDNNYQKFIRKVRHCARYYAWRNEVKTRDKEKCVKCSRSKNITVHHKYVTMYDFVKKYGFDEDAIYNDGMFFDVKNGETLCRRCHAKNHRR